MTSAKKVGRLTGVLLLVQLVGLILPFVLLQPLTSRAQDFLANGAGNSFQVKLAVFLLFANGVLTIGIAIAAFPVFREHSPRTALWLLALSIIWFSLQAVDNVYLLSMLSLSQQHAQSGGPAELFQTLAAMVNATRRWTHYSELFVIDAWIVVLYSLLFRFSLVPRAVAAFGLITVFLHFTGIPLPLFLGYRSVTLMGVPMALSHVTLAAWLMAKGFKERTLYPRGSSAADDET